MLGQYGTYVQSSIKMTDMRKLQRHSSGTLIRQDLRPRASSMEFHLQRLSQYAAPPIVECSTRL